MKSNSEVLAEHADARNLTPGARSTLLLTYLCVRHMFPDMSLPEFLKASDRVAGATKENRLSPKDAIDYHCPTKGSQWPPAKRLQVMLEYLDFCDSLPAHEGDMPLDTFLTAVLAPAVPEESATPEETSSVEVQSQPEPQPQQPQVVTPVSPQPVSPQPVSLQLAAPPAAASPTALLPPGSSTTDVTLTVGTARARADQLLSQPASGTAIGDPMLQFHANCEQYLICLDITNGEPRPFVDVYVRDTSVDKCPVVFEMPPSAGIPSSMLLRIRPDFHVNLTVN